MVCTRWKAYISFKHKCKFAIVYACIRYKADKACTRWANYKRRNGQQCFRLMLAPRFWGSYYASTFNWKIINHRGNMVLFKLQILWRSAWVHFQVTFSKAYFEVKSGVVFYCGDTSLHRWSLKETGRKEIWSFLVLSEEEKMKGTEMKTNIWLWHFFTSL